MSRRISDATKIKQKRGTGHFADYKPWIRLSEFSSRGTGSVIPDWKHGRGIQCMSQLEAMWYYILRFDDDNIDINEQYPLDYDETVRIADTFGFNRPAQIMTTDFVVMTPGFHPHAYTVKPDLELPKKELEHLYIEREYWHRHDTPYDILVRSELNIVLADNIRQVTRYYNEKDVYDRYSEIKHEIAVKNYSADLSKKPIDKYMLDEILMLCDNQHLSK